MHFAAQRRSHGLRESLVTTLDLERDAGDITLQLEPGLDEVPHQHRYIVGRRAVLHVGVVIQIDCGVAPAEFLEEFIDGLVMLRAFG